jgi:uncharacterized RDD family membrane protein YckC
VTDRAILASLDSAAGASSTRAMREANPYAPPADDQAPDSEDADEAWLDASGGARFANLLIDQLVLNAVAYAIAYALTASGVKEVAAFFQLLIVVGYYVLFEALFQRTPGKFITGTKVIAYGGGKPSFGQIVGRSFARLVPFEWFSFLGGSGGWHDTWTRTRVVKVR